MKLKITAAVFCAVLAAGCFGVSADELQDSPPDVLYVALFSDSSPSSPKKIFGPLPDPRIRKWDYMRNVSLLDREALDEIKIHLGTLPSEETPGFATFPEEAEAPAAEHTLDDIERFFAEKEEDHTGLAEMFTDDSETPTTDALAESLEEDETPDFFEKEIIASLDSEEPEVTAAVSESPNDTMEVTSLKNLTENFLEQYPAAPLKIANEPASEEVPAETKKKSQTIIKETAEIKPPPAPEPPPRKYPPLTASEKELAERINRTLEVYRKISLATDENRPSDIMLFAIPYGCKVGIYHGDRESEKSINAIAALCWNLPMHGQVTFNPASETLMPNFGYGIQRYPGQLLATFALSRVSVDYSFPAGSADTKKTSRRTYTVGDLIDTEKNRCREDADLSFVLIGLSYYLEPDAVWEDSDGTLWSLEKVVYHELTRKPSLRSSEITNQLLGLTCAVRCRKQRSDAPLSEVYLAAEKYLADYREFALRNMNEWNCWHPQYFEFRGISHRQRNEMFFASANILRWLVLDAPAQDLSDPRIMKALDVIERLAYDHVHRWNPCEASAQEMEGVSAALHAMMIYEKRYIAPRK